MLVNQSTFREDLRELFCSIVYEVFGNAQSFIDFLEDEKYSTKYDCYLDNSGENYIINRETGEYINWYKFYHLGRCITISASHLEGNITKWMEKFIIEFKESGVGND